MAGGECGAADRVEDREARGWPGDAPQLDEAVVGRGEVVDDAGREDRVAGAVGEGKANRIGENERGVPIAAGVTSDGQHLPGHIEGDDPARGAHLGAERSKGSAGSRPEVEHGAPGRWRELGRGTFVRRSVVGEASIPGGGAGGEEGLRVIEWTSAHGDSVPPFVSAP